jgi:hypothetical protein
MRRFLICYDFYDTDGTHRGAGHTVKKMESLTEVRLSKAIREILTDHGKGADAIVIRSITPLEG